MKTETNGELEAVVHDRGLLNSPRPSVDREQLQHHLREVLRLLHVDLEDENVRDTPRRWAESLVTMTSVYDFTGVKKLATPFRKACSTADEKCQNLVVIGGTYKTLCAPHPALLRGSSSGTSRTSPSSTVEDPQHRGRGTCAGCSRRST